MFSNGLCDAPVKDYSQAGTLMPNLNVVTLRAVERMNFAKFSLKHSYSEKKPLCWIENNLREHYHLIRQANDVVQFSIAGEPA